MRSASLLFLFLSAGPAIAAGSDAKARAALALAAAVEEPQAAALPGGCRCGPNCPCQAPPPVAPPKVAAEPMPPVTYAEVLAAVEAGRELTVYAGRPVPAGKPGAVGLKEFPGRPAGVYRCFLRDGRAMSEPVPDPPPNPAAVAPAVVWEVVTVPTCRNCR